MNYCSQCGAGVELRVPAGDNLPRHVCGQCGEIHYINPKVVVGCIPRWQDKILLCRRAIEPRYGLWTLPAGFLENNETTIEGAIREMLEEASAKVRIASLYTLFNLPHISQVYVMFLADLIAPEYGPGTESLEVELYDERDIPWDQIAFPVIEETLRLFFADRRHGRFPVHTGDIRRLSVEERVFDVQMLES
ncbi:MAG: zinc ribbon domain-containing protein [Gammaproteobacteria bacterium]|nr:zinc ribbon domain-containing protein [Gammaproteobacteria bacterium]